MRGIGATAVAAVILFIVDQLLNAGRYSEVVANALIQVGSIAGIHVQRSAWPQSDSAFQWRVGWVSIVGWREPAGRFAVG